MRTRQPQIILGVDPGIATTGVGVIQTTTGDRPRHVYHGVLTTLKTFPEAERLLKLSHDFGALLKRFRPDCVAIEKLFFAANVKTAMTVGQARGVLVLGTAKHHLPLHEFTPLEVKLAVTSYGRADKSQIKTMVKMILELPELPAPDDAADALAIAITASHRLPLCQAHTP